MFKNNQSLAEKLNSIRKILYTAKKGLESVVCTQNVFLCIADSERIYRSSLNFQRIFPTSLSPISVKSN